MNSHFEFTLFTLLFFKTSGELNLQFKKINNIDSNNLNSSFLNLLAIFHCRVKISEASSNCFKKSCTLIIASFNQFEKTIKM